jgi:hypothetical protein
MRKYYTTSSRADDDKISLIQEHKILNEPEGCSWRSSLIKTVNFPYRTDGGVEERGESELEGRRTWGDSRGDSGSGSANSAKTNTHLICSLKPLACTWLVLLSSRLGVVTRW